jgi:hypothetical protein
VQELSEVVHVPVQGRSAALGAEAEATLRSALALALLLSGQGALEEALPLLQGTLATARRVFGEDAEITLEAMAAQAQLHVDMGRVGLCVCSSCVYYKRDIQR